MFRDYPNMSYCMCQNTEAALNQIMDAMDEQGDAEFIKELSMDELRSFNEILHIAEQFVRRAERALDRVADDRVNEVIEGDE
jgi:hypothetical protein